MDRDQKFSGTLPLLAYAPQDFGQIAQRSRAYRARAAMGRTGVQPLRSHTHAPLKSDHTKPQNLQINETASEQNLSFLRKCWLQLTALFKNNQNGTKAPSPVAQAGHADDRAKFAKTQTVNSAGALSRLASQARVKTPATAQSAKAGAGLTETDSQPVSKTYAAMRKNGLNAAADDQSIPQAPDLAHALAEIRQALREHEKLAQARLTENRTD